jgi:hypothetical protein
VNTKLSEVEVSFRAASSVDIANDWVYVVCYAFANSHITAVLRLSEFVVVISFLERFPAEFSQSKNSRVLLLPVGNAAIYLSYYE